MSDTYGIGGKAGVAAGLTAGNVPGRTFSKCPREARCPPLIGG